MANALYSLGKKAILDGSIAFLTDDIRIMLVDIADETFNDADQFVSNVTGAGIVARSGALGTKTTTAGTFDAADITINAVTGDQLEVVILYKFNASDAAAPLIAWIDASPSISFTPNGSNVTVTFDALGIFSI